MSELRRHASTLIVTLAMVAALVVVLFVDRGAVSTNEATMRKRNLFEAWRPDDITRVAIRRDGKTAVLVRAAMNDAGQRPWDVEIDGGRHAGEEQVIDQVLGVLEFAVAERRIEADAVDRRAMGLDAPTIEVVIDMGAQHYDFALGGAAPTPPGARYAEVKGHGVAVVKGELVAGLDLDLDRFRTRSFVPYFSVDLAGFEITGPAGHAKLLRAPWAGSRSPSFRLDALEQGGARVSTAALDKLFTGLAELQAEAFVAEDAALEAPVLRLSLVPTDAKKPASHIEIGGACPSKPDDLLARRDAPTKLAVCVPRAAVEALEVAPKELVDDRLVGAPSDEITEVKVEADGRTLELARTGTEWHERAPADRTVDAESGRLFLGAMLGVHGTLMTPPNAPDVAMVHSARIVSILSGEDVDGGHEERIEGLHWSADANGVTIVRRDEDGAVFSVSSSLMSPFSGGDLALRSRKIVDEKLEDLRALEVLSAKHPQRVERAEDGTFKLVSPKGKGLAADQGLVSDFGQSLAGLVADRWVESSGRYGLESSELAVEGTFGENQPHKVKIAIGDAADGGHYAQRVGDNSVFVVPSAFVVRALTLLVDRGALAVDVSDIRGATLTAGKHGKVRLRSNGATWLLEGATKASDASGVREALAELVAEAAVEVGPPRADYGLEHPILELVIERESGAPARVVIGAGDSFQGTAIHYARRDGVDATFAVARGKVAPLLEAAGGE